jgi:predicted amidohydrolase
MALGLIRIAAAQYPIEQLPTLGAYRDKVARWVGEAASAGAELLVFPEYGAMEYAGAFGTTIASDLAASLAAVSGALEEMDAAHADLARRHRVHILAASGPSARPGGRYVNAARLFTPDGQMGVQEKLIMTPFEVNWGISPGERLRVFETTLGRIGVAVCYESEFPLLVRAQAEAGARLILVPSCTEFASGHVRIRTAARARALENTCATVVSPTVGDAAWSPAVDRNAGVAGVYVPADHSFSDSGVVAEGLFNAPQWLHAEVDLSRLERLKATGEMRNSTDWVRQPGAAPLDGAVELVPLV